jgi:large subunit ribosomal protein L29
MPKQDKKNLHSLSNDQLRESIITLEKQIQEARLKLAAGKLDKPSQIKNDLIELARIKTIIRERELTGQSE